MKKIIYSLVALSLIISSCAIIPKPSTYVFMLDYSPLTQKGFYVTESNSVGFDYEAVGSIYVESVAGWGSKKEAIKGENQYKGDDAYYSPSSPGRGGSSYSFPSIEDSFSALARKLQE